MDWSRMVAQRYDVALYGAISWTEELLPGVYYVSGYRLTEGLKRYHRFIVTPIEYKGILSKQALAYGTERKGLLYFQSEHPVILYELRRHQLLQEGLTPKQRAEAEKGLLAAARYCSDDYPGYFGEVPPPPAASPWGPITRYRRIGHCFYHVQSAGRWYLALSESIWGPAMTIGTKPEPPEAVRVGGYLFYPRERCARLAYEMLTDGRPERLEELVDRELLIAELWELHGNYVRELREDWEITKQVMGEFDSELQVRGFLMGAGIGPPEAPTVRMGRPGAFLRQPEECGLRPALEGIFPDDYDGGRFGPLNSFTALEAGFYQATVQSTGKDGGSIYVFDRRYTGDDFSPALFEAGELHGGLCCLTQGKGRELVDYELLLRRRRRSGPDNRQLDCALEAYTQQYALRYPGYFGRLPPPWETTWGFGGRYLPVTDGVWMVQVNGRWFLALCHGVWAGLDKTALACGVRQGGAYPWLLFPREDSALPIMELLRAGGLPGIRRLELLLVSRQALEQNLWARWPGYMESRGGTLWDSEELTGFSCPEGCPEKNVGGPTDAVPVEFLHMPDDQ